MRRWRGWRWHLSTTVAKQEIAVPDHFSHPKIRLISFFNASQEQHIRRYSLLSLWWLMQTLLVRYQKVSSLVWANFACKGFLSNQLKKQGEKCISWSIVTLIKGKASYKLVYKEEQNESLATIAGGPTINWGWSSGTRGEQKHAAEDRRRSNNRGKRTETSKGPQTETRIWAFEN